MRNLNEEEELSATGFKDGPRAQEHDPVAMEEAVLFNEKMVIKEEQGAYRHVPTSKHRAYGAQPDNSLGAEAVDDMQGRHSSPSVTEKGRVRTQESRPTVGAFPVGGIDIEEGYEEDEFTIEEENEDQAPEVTHEIPVNPISAKLVNAEQEEKRLQEKINEAVQKEREQAVVAAVAPRTCTRKMQLFAIGAILLVVVAITTALILMLRKEPSNCEDGYFGPKCDLYYPNCSVDHPELIGDGVCDYMYGMYDYNTTECGWEGGDCVCDDGYFGRKCNLYYPNCSVDYPELIGDGLCVMDYVLQHDGVWMGRW